MSIVLIATLTVAPEQRDKALEIINGIVPEVHAEPGCELYAPHTSGKDKITFIEQWADKESLDAHASGPAFARLKSKLSGIAPDPAVVQALRPAFPGDAGKGTIRA